ncbi:MAG: calcium-binding protein, partial [Selenomonadaceae bacterium]|nr:calcium-binding protein [Selenomonadaceae bacterium]
ATINGAAADSVSIKGNSQNNLIIGGAGNDTLYGGGNKNDTLTGGDGADVFIFGSGDGKDVITDYSDSDTIYIGSSSVASASISGSDILFTIGKGTLTVKDGVGQKINFQDSSGTTSTNIYEKGAIYDGDKTSVTFTSGLKVTLESSVVTADGSAVSDALKIVGNDLNNTIYGGSGKDTLYGGAGADFLSGGAGNDTLYGGAGNDTLTGGDGKNVFVYEGGNDTITDYAAGDKIKFTGTVNVSYSGNDVVFSTSKGSVTVTDGAGKNITTVVGSKTTTRLYSNSNARTADLFYDNNFISDDNNLDSITEQKFTVTQINTEEDKTFAQDKNILTFAKDK